MNIQSPADLPELHINDIVTLRKTHPCGSNQWRITRLGADIGLKCFGCEHKIMLTRRKLARAAKSIISEENNTQNLQKEQDK